MLRHVKRGRSARGMALLEVAIGAALIAMVVVLSLSAIESVGALNEHVRNERIALQAAQAKLGYLRAHDFSRIAVDVAASTTLTSFAVAGLPRRQDGLPAGQIEVMTNELSIPDEFGLGPTYDLDASGTLTNPTGSYLILPIRVTVKWGSPSGQDSSIKLLAILNQGDAP